MRAALADLLSARGVLLADGATGTNYFQMGLTSGEAPEHWNVDHPERVQSLHRRFVDAGADIVLTNTFGCNRHRLALHDSQDRVRELARRGAELAGAVAEDSERPVVVAGSVGPTGSLFEPLGELTESDAIETFTEQVEALVEGGADVAWIETMSAPEEVRAAANAAIGVGIPYVATCSFDTAGRTMMGLLPGDLVGVFDGLAVPPVATGANCGVGAPDILVSLLAMTESDPDTAFVSKGNCGIPEFHGAEIRYSGTPELMAEYVEARGGRGRPHRGRLLRHDAGAPRGHARRTRRRVGRSRDRRHRAAPVARNHRRHDRSARERRTELGRRAASPPSIARRPTMTAILTLSCPDRPGLVHAVSGYLVEVRANIVESAQFEDPLSGRFFMRIRFDLLDPTITLHQVRTGFAPLAAANDMAWDLVDATTPTRTLILVSRLGHCLNDLVYRQSVGTLNLEIPAVVSNHEDLRPLAEAAGIPYHHVAVTSTTKPAAERALLDLIDELDIHLVVLARYMQVLSDDLCTRLAGRAINIHHSFLPAFVGAKPYHQAYVRGVKLIGATAHYVTTALDAGPIIEQDVARVDHTMAPAALAAAGHDVEAQVLARAVRWHSERRVLLNGDRTVVVR